MMAIKLEANSRNGTLSINQQTVIQREKFSSTFSGLGVATANASKLFSSSPIGDADSETNIDRSGSSDRSSLYEDRNSNVYDAFISVVDPENGTQKNGFGFEGAATAYLNYDHPQNPFLGSTAYTELTDGSASATERAYAGHPDLVVPEDGLDRPSTLDNNTPEAVELNLTQNVNYGHTANEYRLAIRESPGMLGRHVESGEGNGAPDTIGRYFNTNF
jgi:hypothetical protein